MGGRRDECSCEHPDLAAYRLLVEVEYWLLEGIEYPYGGGGGCSRGIQLCATQKLIWRNGMSNRWEMAAVAERGTMRCGNTQATQQSRERAKQSNAIVVVM